MCTWLRLFSFAFSCGNEHQNFASLKCTHVTLKYSSERSIGRTLIIIRNIVSKSVLHHFNVRYIRVRFSFPSVVYCFLFFVLRVNKNREMSLDSAKSAKCTCQWINSMNIYKANFRESCYFAISWWHMHATWSYHCALIWTNTISIFNCQAIVGVYGESTFVVTCCSHTSMSPHTYYNTFRGVALLKHMDFICLTTIANIFFIRTQNKHHCLLIVFEHRSWYIWNSHWMTGIETRVSKCTYSKVPLNDNMLFENGLKYTWVAHRSDYLFERRKCKLCVQNKSQQTSKLIWIWLMWQKESKHLTVISIFLHIYCLSWCNW